MLGSLIGLAAHARPHYDFDDDQVTGELSRPADPGPNGDLSTDAIDVLVDETISHDRKMWAAVDADNQKWFDREAIGGHSIEFYGTGEETHQARLKLIRGAQSTIFLSSFQIDDDKSSREIVHELCLKAQGDPTHPGIEVRLMLDSFGLQQVQRRSGGRSPYLRRLGVFRLFRALLARRTCFMSRTLLLIVDGRELIIGGSNYSDKFRECVAGIAWFGTIWTSKWPACRPAGCIGVMPSTGARSLKRPRVRTWDAMGAGG